MPKPFDASTKFLIELAPEDWLRFLKLPIGPSEMIETDLSTITAAGDRILRVNTVPPYGLHVEFQAGPDDELEERVWEYNVLYTRRLKLPVETTLVLLRPFGNHKKLTGRFQVVGPAGRRVHDFPYEVVRVWELPPEVFLEGGSGLLPLAPVAKVSRAEVPQVVQAVNERLERNHKPSEAEQLRTATFVLMGLKYPKEFVEKLMSRNVLELSSTYQALIQEGLDKGLQEGLDKGLQEGLSKGLERGLEQGTEQGRTTEARRLILRWGTKRLGALSSQVEAALNAADLERLEVLADRLPEAESWEELLAE
ncbi:hypothetical protein [Armatimonas sp.]|uniref:hypothetical protein n=1 Tax=Armatimonas sp. TaxID=1872638 RepID=UPI00286CD5C8|nr:hypothetical protein [Armatimonas sp.]